MTREAPSCPATTPSACTTRSASRSTSSRTSRASRACRSIARGSRRRWRRSGSGRVRAAHSTSAREPPSSTPTRRRSPADRASARPVRGLHDHRGARRRRARGLFDAERRQVDRLDAGVSRIRRARPHAVLRRVGRPGVRRRTILVGEDAVADVDGMTRLAPARSARPPRDGAGTARRRPARHRPGLRRGPRRHASQSHRHPPAARRPAPAARRARPSGGIARGARPAALRLHAHPADRRAGPPSDRTRRERGDLPQRHGDDRDPSHRGGHQRGRDGALRREVRRHGPRRLGARLQPGALRRHARARDRRHRPVRHHR